MKTIKKTLKIIKKLLFAILIFLMIYSASAFLLSKNHNQFHTDFEKVFIRAEVMHSKIILHWVQKLNAKKLENPDSADLQSVPTNKVKPKIQI